MTAVNGAGVNEKVHAQFTFSVRIPNEAQMESNKNTLRLDLM